MATALHISSEWERPALPTGDGAATLMTLIVAPVMPGLAPASRPSVDLAFVIDRSGSMAGRPISLPSKRSARRPACSIGATAPRWSCTTITPMLIHPLLPVEVCTRNELRLGSAQVDARGSTNLCDGWLTGCRELARHEMPAARGERIRRAILLTDGPANEGERSPDCHLPACHRAPPARHQHDDAGDEHEFRRFAPFWHGRSWRRELRLSRISVATGPHLRT